MLPKTFNFYVDPDVDLLSLMSITTVVQGIVVLPATVAGLILRVGRFASKCQEMHADCSSVLDSEDRSEFACSSGHENGLNARRRTAPRPREKKEFSPLGSHYVNLD